MEKAEWGRSTGLNLPERWPRSADGEPERPALLCKCFSTDMEAELRINMLEAYSIPCLCNYPGDGGFGKLIMGMSGNGVEIYVPESMYNDAVTLCKEETVDNEEL